MNQRRSWSMDSGTGPPGSRLGMRDSAEGSVLATPTVPPASFRRVFSSSARWAGDRAASREARSRGVIGLGLLRDFQQRTVKRLGQQPVDRGSEILQRLREQGLVIVGQGGEALRRDPPCGGVETAAHLLLAVE